MALVLSLGIAAVPMAGTAEAATLYENCTTEDSGYATTRSSFWLAQSFAAESDHWVTSVRLKLHRS